MCISMSKPWAGCWMNWKTSLNQIRRRFESVSYSLYQAKDNIEFSGAYILAVQCLF